MKRVILISVIMLFAYGIKAQKGTITGSGTGSSTTGYIPRFTSSLVIANSNIYQNSNNIGIGTISPGKMLELYFASTTCSSSSTANNPAIRLNWTCPGTVKGTIPTTRNYNTWDIENIAGNFYFKYGTATNATTSPTTSPLVVFCPNGNVGIGTGLSASQKLHVVGNSCFIGNVGIGIVSPTQKFQVDAGNILVRGTSNFATAGNEAYLYLGDVNNYIKSVSGTGIKIGTYGASDAIFLQQGTGNVGIGTSNFVKGSNLSYYKMAVKGNIHVFEVVVETGWSDFVFDKDYKLKSLSEVENFINEHKHLPDVPSAADVAENGVSVGQTESILLQKIEELTLYMIDLKKENEQLKERISNLENK